MLKPNNCKYFCDDNIIIIAINIVDNNFEQQIIIPINNNFSFSEMFYYAIIKAYSKRNLNVAANLAVFMNAANKTNISYRGENIKDQISSYKNNSILLPFINDIEKYLLLI